jgi:aerobic carbon-monoxide dehydrogenase large subunit
VTRTTLLGVPKSVGMPILRTEDDRLIKGLGCFVGDISRPDQLHARIVRSQVAHARLVKVHLEEARTLMGVVAAFAAADIPGIGEKKIPVRISPGRLDQFALQTPLALDKVRYVGEPIAVVVATDPYLAEDAADLVWAELEELSPQLDPIAGAGSSVLHEMVPDNVVGGFDTSNGEDVDDLFRQADVLVQERFSIHRHSAAPMEPRGLVAETDRQSGRLTVWGPTKVKHFNKRVLAALLGLPEDRILLIEPDVGGGFGPRGEFYPEDFLIPWLALQLGRPVKWVEDRYENFIALNHSREHIIDLAVAARADGTLLGFRCTDWCSIGAYVRTTGLTVAKLTGLHMSGPYRWRGFSSKVVGVLTNKTPAGTYRGPGEVEATFVRERALDMLAARLDLDPPELRRRNLIPAESLPFRLETGPGSETLEYGSGNYPAVLTDLLSNAGYQNLRRDQARRRRLGEAVGIGIACFLDQGGIGPFEQARVVAESDGTFTGFVGVASVGQGVQTALAQILADELEVSVNRVRIHHHDTDSIEDGMGAYASRTTSVGGSALVLAARQLRQQARSDGARHLGAADHEVELRGDEVWANDGRAVTFGALGCEASGRFETTTVDFSFGTVLAVVSVDRGTGKVRVERYIGHYDVGRAVNPLIVRGQLEGGAAQGIGGALLEELAYDSQGQPLCTSFMDYMLPTLSELPEVESAWSEFPSKDNLIGAKGVGEAGIIGTLAVIANAVADALSPDGIVVTSTPFTADRVRALLRSAGSYDTRHGITSTPDPR